MSSETKTKAIIQVVNKWIQDMSDDDVDKAIHHSSESRIKFIYGNPIDKDVDMHLYLCLDENVINNLKDNASFMDILHENTSTPHAHFHLYMSKNGEIKIKISDLANREDVEKEECSNIVSFLKIHQPSPVT